jgi:hypothetical protein
MGTAAASFGFSFALFPSGLSRRKMGMIVANELTPKERLFAQLIVLSSKSAAYRSVYSAKGTPATQAVNAYKLSRKPKIRAEVDRLLRQRACPADDYARVRDVAVAGLTEILIQEPDPRLRVKAGSILLDYANTGLRLHPEPTDKERKYDEIIHLLDELMQERQLTASREQEPLAVEVERTDAGLLPLQAGDEALGGGDLKAEPPVTAGPGNLEAPMNAETKDSAPEEGFKVVPVPGYFPPRFRRIRVPLSDGQP